MPRIPNEGYSPCVALAVPIPLGVSFVDLVRQEGRVLVVRGLDALNGTPLLDIKPFVMPGD